MVGNIDKVLALIFYFSDKLTWLLTAFIHVRRRNFSSVTEVAVNSVCVRLFIVRERREKLAANQQPWTYFQTFAVLVMFYLFFWAIPRRLPFFVPTFRNTPTFIGRLNKKNFLV